MRDVVLVIAEEGDWHANVVSTMLRRQHSVRVAQLAMSRFPQRAHCTYTIGDGSVGYTWTDVDGRRIHSDDVFSVWWRRPEACATERVYGDSPDFIQAECDHLLQGALCSSRCAWMNEPFANARASRKIIQLAAANEVGLPVPETIVSNDTVAIRRFIETLGPSQKVICKRIATTPGVLTKTTFVTAAAVKPDILAPCPATFQRYIVPRRDLRVIAIDDCLWSVGIDTPQAQYPEDSRFDHSVAYEEEVLPSHIADRVRALMRALGLRYGAVDMRIGADDGEYYFLEVNPAGQCGYLQIKTGLPILESIANALADVSHGSHRSTSTRLPTHEQHAAMSNSEELPP